MRHINTESAVVNTTNGNGVIHQLDTIITFERHVCIRECTINNRLIEDNHKGIQRSFGI